jgi:hypothetical protein
LAGEGAIRADYYSCHEFRQRRTLVAAQQVDEQRLLGPSPILRTQADVGAWRALLALLQC